MSAEILIVDDDPDMRELLETDLANRGFVCRACRNGEAALAVLREHDIDVVLTDVRMQGMDGIEFCARSVANRPDTPVVIMTAFGSLETAMAAIRAGAYDFVTKPIDLDILGLALRRAVQTRTLRRELELLAEAVRREEPFEELIGKSPAMKTLFEQMHRVADVDASILITGETGTGKELVARALHRRSGRADRPFIAVNCSALPETLLESELFGHVKGAFTGALADRKGLLVQADGGTLFLDEIGDLPRSLQPKLLRVLEESRVRPVGGEKEIPFDARIITATNRDLDSVMADGEFREDLYYRINVVHLELPPLRTRGSDILLLAQYFLDRYADQFGKDVSQITEAAAQRLLDYAWPGNVRELRNAMERAVALAVRNALTPDDLPERVRSYRSTMFFIAGDNPQELITAAELERRYILHVMEATQGNRTMASRILGINRKTLYRKLQQYGFAEDGDESSGECSTQTD